jgi:hypothetical protein
MFELKRRNESARLRAIAALPVLALAALAVAAVTSAAERLTPLLLTVHDAPVPFNGSDGRRHLVYELWITNFTSGDATVEKVEVLGDGKSIATFVEPAIARRLQPAGRRDATALIPGGGVASVRARHTGSGWIRRTAMRSFLIWAAGVSRSTRTSSPGVSACAPANA